MCSTLVEPALVEPALVEPAPAKLNLFLHVTGKRDDGYHLLESLVCFAQSGDVIRGAPRDDGEITLHLTGPMAPALDQDAAQDNLVVRAARGLQQLCGVKTGADLILEKNLPVASGIGGGSADAAATLRLLCRLWDVKPAQDDLAKLALSLGADVPVCLAGGTVLMRGIGEVLDPLPDLGDFALVLVNPGKAVSTPAIFKARDPVYTEPGAWGQNARFDDAQSLATALGTCRNDLTLPAAGLLPEICEVLDGLARQEDCLLARMSGSGATCFGLYATATAAQTAANALRNDHPDWWCTATTILGAPYGQ
jgi:4-diphosphocytidyl-2-C-methyl-D-erythritol kinase